MDKKLSLEQMSKANGLLQKLVDGVNKRHEGKGGINAFEAYEIIEEIYKIINGEEI